jgi:hypothetical protein
MTGVFYLEPPVVHKESHAASVHLYFKLPGGDTWKCTHWEKSVKLGQGILALASERKISPKV